MSVPSWWTNHDVSAWERVREALQRDWDQTRHDLHVGGHELNQKLGDTLEQALGHAPLPPIDRANPPKVIGTWKEVEVPIGYGYAARTHFGDRFPQWNDELERLLARDWHTAQPWSHVRLYVRHGYEMSR